MKYVSWIIVIAVIVGGVWYFVSGGVETTTITSDTTIDGDYVVEEGQRIVLMDGASLAVEGNTIVRGEISGPDGVALVLAGNVVFEESSLISSGGSVQIVSRHEDLLTTQELIDAAFDEAGEDSGTGPRVGPIVPDGGSVSAAGNWDPKRVTLADKAVALITQSAEKAYAQEEEPDVEVDISGKIDLSDADAEDKKKRKKIVLISFPASAGKVQMNFKNLNFISPQNTPKGTDDLNNSCNAKGENGADGLRLRAEAWGIDINNVTIQLTKGGDGGDATTKEDCDPGVAVGGKGGDSGNMKFTATGRLVISGAFHIIPGKSGNGGNANATGKDGGPGENGGDADATGGNGADNDKKLAVEGNVVGTDNITVDELFGGNGGVATATGGKGGDNAGCGKNGGKGGGATAKGGKGGDASLVIFGTPSPVFDVGGNGGDANANAGAGGKGGDCDSKGAGGDGGDGGDASDTEGKGGTGDTNGTDGTAASIGGDGGNGGNGCPEGAGGAGGKGDTPGNDGEDGKNLCVAEKQKTDIKVGDDVVATKTNMSYAHVAPGQYSEVYMDITGAPGAFVSVNLSGPAVEQPNAGGTIGSDGKLRLTWTIYQYGTYSASGTAGGVSVSGSVSVQ